MDKWHRVVLFGLSLAFTIWYQNLTKPNQTKPTCFSNSNNKFNLKSNLYLFQYIQKQLYIPIAFILFCFDWRKELKCSFLFCYCGLMGYNRIFGGISGKQSKYKKYMGLFILYFALKLYLLRELKVFHSPQCRSC